MIKCRLNGDSISITVADRKAGAEAGSGVGTSQYQAVDAALKVYSDTGLITFTKQSVDYKGEVGEEAYWYKVATKHRNVAKMIMHGIEVFDNAKQILNINAVNRSWIDGVAAGTAMPEQTRVVHPA